VTHPVAVKPAGVEEPPCVSRRDDQSE
jgi:hypothetical protein